MNLYKITRNDRCGYDEYDGFIMAAETEEEASGYLMSKWLEHEKEFGNWNDPYLIGVAIEGLKAGRILESFNAG